MTELDQVSKSDLMKANKPGLGFLDLPEAIIEINPENLPPLVLAYVGDAVYELYVRCRLVASGLTRVGPLHQEAIKLVRATCQAQFLHQIEENLTEEEQRVMKRGRNAKSGHVPRSTEVVDYRWSTGLESIIGYLYLKRRYDRLQEILSRLPWPNTEKSTLE